MSVELGILAGRLERAGYPEGARKVRTTAEELAREGLIPSSLIPDKPRVVDTHALEVEIDPAVDEKVKEIQALFDAHARGEEVVYSHTLSPQFASDFRNKYGRNIPSETEIFELVTLQRSGDTFPEINSKQRAVMGKFLNVLSRSGLTTVGSIREVNAAAFLSRPGLESRLTPGILIFAKNAFDNKEQPQAGRS